jgi:putative transposase
MITYKFRAYPNQAQQAKLWEHSIALNSLYNYFLDQRIKAYEAGNKIYRKHQQAELVQLKKDKPELKAIHSQAVQQVPLRLDKSYKFFFKHMNEGAGLPNFRSRKQFFTLTYPQSWYKLIGNYFVTNVYGKIKLLLHKEIQGKVKQVSLVNQDNKWYLCITTDWNYESNSSDSVVGVDVGVTNLVATSNGDVIVNQNHAKYFDREINKLKSRRDSSCKKGSKRYKNWSQIIKRLYGAKKRKTNDFLHKVSKRLTQQYDTIVVEDLSVKKISESKATGLNREIRNSGLSRFLGYLEYKAGLLVKVDPYNTSKRCCVCGKIHNMPLSKRTLHCECGNVMDRDINAAKNILCLGQARLAEKLSGTAAPPREAPAFRQG